MSKHIPGDEKSSARIIRFPRKRGRPKSIRRSSDTGTPELVMKRILGETGEALDLCLERGIISPEQHWCGIHLRWLYTLRHGAPGVRAIDPAHLGGLDNKQDDPEWRAAREKEYHEAIHRLVQSGHDVSLLLNLCIYNERPQFLEKKTAPKRQPHHSLIMHRIQEALATLTLLWGRKPPKTP